MTASPAGVLRRTGALVVAASLTLAACSSSGGGSSPSKSAGSSSQAVSTAPVSSPPESSGAASGGGQADAATTEAVTKAYTTFFNYKSGVPASEKLLQLGPKFDAALKAQAKTASAQHITVTVSKVELESPHVAKVTFTVLGAGKPLLPDTPGLAVQENGTWKVAAQTFCALVQLQGAAPNACQDPAVLSPSP